MTMKKKIILMTAILVVAIGAAVVCLWQMNLFGLQDLIPKGTADYNTAATNYGLTMKEISTNEILLTHTVSTAATGDVTVTFLIYSVAPGYNKDDFLKLSAQEAAALPGLTGVGSGSVIFIGGDLKNIRGFQVMHNM